ncbi:cytochrome c1 [Frigidibacter sp. SD6-1]|uniref:cytochrome c1 n=1 Tax=Frigidibacter sp. SD6-1 TaxID=3032581 RepID=UPI0024E03D5C|nr:cytochrome c1 [Frigidibacter sp. SD6-1]
MLKKLAITAVSALTLLAGQAMAAGGEGGHIEDHAFSFEGPFGTFDEHQLQRGLQVYTEVCSACHGLRYVPIRSLSDEGGPHLPEDQVRAYAKQFTVVDKETGEEREGKETDNFPHNTGAGAPDLSLMAKARPGFHGPYGLGINQFMRGIGGPEYIHSLITGYHEAPACAPADFPGNYNAVFANGGYPDSCKEYEETVVEKVNADGSVTKVTEKKEVGRLAPGSWIAMPAPLSEGQVTYADGTEATVEQMSEDVTAFLMWAAEPKMMERKQAGFLAVLFLGLLSVLLYLTNKRLWAPHKGKKIA